jgi:2-oxoglutarate ferredoxin oxidoreductase subunit alpha
VFGISEPTGNRQPATGKTPETGNQQPETDSLVIAAYGSSFRSSLGARELAAREGIQVDIFRPVTLWPFPSKALADYAGGRPILVVEMSQGQMVEDVKLALYEHGRGGRVHFLGHSGGVIISEEEIFGKVKEILWKK